MTLPKSHARTRSLVIVDDGLDDSFNLKSLNSTNASSGLSAHTADFVDVSPMSRGLSYDIMQRASASSISFESSTQRISLSDTMGSDISFYDLHHRGSGYYGPESLFSDSSKSLSFIRSSKSRVSGDTKTSQESGASVLDDPPIRSFMELAPRHSLDEVLETTVRGRQLSKRPAPRASSHGPVVRPSRGHHRSRSMENKNKNRPPAIDLMASAPLGDALSKLRLPSINLEKFRTLDLSKDLSLIPESVSGSETSSSKVFVGIIDNAKKSFAFVKDEGSDSRYFFHFSELRLPDGVAIEVGDRVRFGISEIEPGKFKAINVRLVEKGALSEEEARKSHKRDKTLAMLKNNELKVQSPASSDVEFKSKSDFETGTIVSTKQRYGFINCPRRNLKQLFFHFSELATHNNIVPFVEPGTEVTFSISSSSKGKLIATNIEVSQTSISVTPSRTVVLRGIVETSSPSFSAPDKCSGIIKCTNTNDEEFKSDLMERRYSFEDESSLYSGDLVDFSLRYDTRTGKELVHSVTVLKLSKANRFTGLVRILKDRFGFIRSVQSPELLFFHFNDIFRMDAPISCGAEVEFNIGKDSKGQLVAARVSNISAGSVDPSLFIFKGFVNPDQHVLYFDDFADHRSPDRIASTRPGDLVEFQLDPRTRNLVNIRSSPRMGIVEDRFVRVSQFRWRSYIVNEELLALPENLRFPTGQSVYITQMGTTLSGQRVIISANLI